MVNIQYWSIFMHYDGQYSVLSRELEKSDDQLGQMVRESQENWCWWPKLLMMVMIIILHLPNFSFFLLQLIHVVTSMTARNSVPWKKG